MNIDINRKQVLSYTLLPGVIPRAMRLFGRGFEWFAVLIASLFASVRLLPHNHAYLLKENHGAFGLRHVVFEAYKNLKWDRQHIDQIAIFGVICTGVVLLFAQFLSLIFMMFLGTSEASILFASPPQSPAESDGAFMILDYVFGIPGIYESCALGDPDGSTGIAPCENIPAFGDPAQYPYHAGLHSMMEFYSWSLLFVALIIFLYFVVVILAETATTGVPFGSRFNTIWGPIRLLMAIGLLLPVAYGLNTGQYLVLGFAKMGSNLATNGWVQYNQAVSNVGGYGSPNPVGEDPGGSGGATSLLPRPNLPDISPFVSAMQLITTCRVAYKKMWDMDIMPYFVKAGSGAQEVIGSTTFQDGFDFYDRGNILIRFGHKFGGGPVYSQYDNYPGRVVPYCGDITVPVTVKEEILNADGDAAGAWEVQRQYFAATKFLWGASVSEAHAGRWAEVDLPLSGNEAGEVKKPCNVSNNLHLSASPPEGTPAFSYEDDVLTAPPVSEDPDCTVIPTQEQQIALYQTRRAQLQSQIDTAWQRLASADIFGIDNEILKYGWAGAGMWYNKLAGIIGVEMDAVESLPHLSRPPQIMAEVRRLIGLEDLHAPGIEQFNPEISGDESIKDLLAAEHGEASYEMAQLFYKVYKSWNGLGGINSLSAMGETNIIASVMHMIFGTQNLVGVLDSQNRDVHPMATLTAIGKDLVNSTLTNLLMSTGANILAGVQNAGGLSANAGVSQAIGGALSSIALVGLTAGFVLFYILPFMPFVYFFFAIGAWIKTIFEAMVGVPLWALAHLRIDGEGLPGDAAANGYFLLLEIMVRPVLCIFGLLGSFAIFGALGRILHEIFPLVANNVVGFDDPNMDIIPGVDIQFKRSIIDQFAFTILYTFIMYILALTCFKLIDLVPDNILRWAGAGVKSFGDYYQDPAESLTSYAASGGYIVGARATQGLGQMGEAAGQGLGASLQRSGADLSGAQYPFMRQEASMNAARANNQNGP